MENQFKIDNLKENDEKGFFQLYQKTWGDSDEEINLVRSASTFYPEYSFYYLKNNEVVSIAGTRQKQIRFFNNSTSSKNNSKNNESNFVEKVPMIFGVSTKEEERRNGYASQLIKTILQKLHSDAYNLAIIGLDDTKTGLESLYQRFGFKSFNNRHYIPFQTLFKKGFSIREGNMDDVKTVNQLFKDYTQYYNIALYRDETLTSYRLRETFVENDGKLFILSLEYPNTIHNSVHKNYKDYAYILHKNNNIIEYINMFHFSNYGFSGPLENADEKEIHQRLEEKGFDYLLSLKNIAIPVAESYYRYENEKVIDGDKEGGEGEKPIKSSYTILRLLNPQQFIHKYLDYLNWSIFISGENNKNGINNEKKFHFKG